MHHPEGSGTPVLYIGRTVLKTLSAVKSERAVPCLDVTHWVSVARPKAGKTSAATLRS